MTESDFESVLATLPGMDSAQLRTLGSALEEAERGIASLRAVDAAKPWACPRCGAPQAVRNGIRNGLQRLLCRACGKTSNAASGTPLSRLRNKQQMLAYAQAMADGLTIRKASEAVGICVDTAFRWRHRFLALPQGHQAKPVSGILEVDETYFRRSHKGARGLARKPRSRGAKTAGRGRSNKDWVAVLVGRARGQEGVVDKVLPKFCGAEIAKALACSVAAGETVICVDGHAAFLHLQTALNVPVKSFVASYKCPGLSRAWHVQSVNSYHERLKTWILRGLRGVATKYLPSYLAWMRLMFWGSGSARAEDYLASALGRQIINL